MTSPTLAFRDNLDEVEELMLIHKILTGGSPGRRHKVETLNKSAILFLCASFEAFIETLAGNSFDFIVDNSPSPEKLPIVIKKSIAKSLNEHKNELKVWELAAEGWKTVAATHKQQIIENNIGHFNTPKFANIDNLLKDLIGFNATGKGFTWKKTPLGKSKEKLKAFVELRGSLAHGAKPAPKVGKAIVIQYVIFLASLSVRLSNEVCSYVEKQVGKAPWDYAHYGSIK